MREKTPTNVELLHAATAGSSTRPGHLVTWPTQLLIALAAAFLVSAPTAAQPEVIRCLPPQVPITELPETVLTEYRAEIAAEFESYFTAISDHIACLDAERTRALTEARAAIAAFATFLNIHPAQKDLP